MVDLIAKSAGTDVLPLTMGPMVAREVDLGALSLCVGIGAPKSDVAGAFQAGHGIAWPAPGRVTGQSGNRAIWFGKDQVMLVGPEPAKDLGAVLAVSDQSDAWMCVTLSGPGVVDVMARLSPVDLRASTFKRGYTARTMIGHMNGSVTRLGADQILIMVFRSMAATLEHELTEAMETVLARS